MKNKMNSTQIIMLIFVLAAIVVAILWLESLHPNRGSSPAEKNLPSGSYKKAPELVGISGWINSDPLTINQLKGKVVIVDFWTYSCINCLRTIPYLNAWQDKYHDQGLVIIGVHTPEFNFEKDYQNVANAAKEYNISYPIALDNDYATWDAYQNQYWPRKYIIDRNGNIRYDHIGEGGYDETELQIQQLLAETGMNVSSGLVNVTDQSPTTQNTPELYAGYSYALPRGEGIGNDGGYVQDKEHVYTLPNVMNKNTIYINGSWYAGKEGMIKTGSFESSVFLTFTAKSADIVAAGNTQTPGNSQTTNASQATNGSQAAIAAKLYVYIDGNFITPDVAGSDVKFDGDKAFILVNEPRLYNIYSGPYQTHRLQLSTNDEGFSFNSFTFG